MKTLIILNVVFIWIFIVLLTLCIGAQISGGLLLVVVSFETLIYWSTVFLIFIIKLMSMIDFKEDIYEERLKNEDL